MQTKYVLLTAAKNEEAYIGETVASVLRQTVHPAAWFIMDDGSTDRTAEIVQGYAREHPFIRLQSAGSRSGRNFGSQYKAIQAAYELAKEMDFECIGVHDADIAPERADYFESILGEFARNSGLGIAGGLIYERQDGEWRARKGNAENCVAGGIQMFRRRCFEQIGGYTPLFHGGSDWLAQIEAKMAGWEVTTRSDQHIFHYRPTSSAGGVWRGMFKAGTMDASFGSRLSFEFLKCCRRITIRPYLFGSVVRFAGFLKWKLTGRKPLIRPEAVAYLQAEQFAKLQRWFRFPGARAARGPKPSGSEC
jgi:glycosyltransferase involved in cell wall biosynthesis